MSARRSVRPRRICPRAQPADMPASAMAIERTLDARASIGCTLPYPLLSATGKILCDESTKTPRCVHESRHVRAFGGR
jgi:hypothetical protein